MSNITPQQLSEIIQQDQQWLEENYEELSQNYSGETVAIEGKQIVAVGDDAVEDYCFCDQPENSSGPLILSFPHQNPQ